jgi:hypothetical protein
MCKSKAEGGRRCDGHGSASKNTTAPPADGEDVRGGESYSGTPWQGYDEYQERAAKLDRRIASGENIMDIMRADQLRRGQEQIERIKREGW